MTNTFSKLACGNSLPEDPEAERKCYGCQYRGLVKTFPHCVNDLGYKTKHKTCDEKDKVLFLTIAALDNVHFPAQIDHICKHWETIVNLAWSP
ncbi:hypothetical protein WG66_009446 [Moniliophthora roreri]|nr:hypothetical protein WG66_009446 [Moniliophthora roreri]